MFEDGDDIEEPVPPIVCENCGDVFPEGDLNDDGLCFDCEINEEIAND